MPSTKKKAAEEVKDTKKKDSAKETKGTKSKKEEEIEALAVDITAEPVAPNPDDADLDLEEGASTGGGDSSSDAEAAAAGGGGAESVSFKNFRHHPEMENFYRFIYENDLRYEALAIIDTIVSKRSEKAL